MLRISKSILLVLICVLALVAMFSVPACAEEPCSLDITVSDTVLARGDEFTVTIELKNNPGVWAIVFEIPIDNDAFEYVEEDVTTSIFDEFGVAEYDETTHSYKVDAYSSDLFSNITSDGTILTLTLRIREDAAFGSYDITCMIDSDNTVNCEETDLTIQAGSASFEIQERVADSSIISANMELGTDITVNYLVDLDPSHVGAQMKFMMSGIEQLVDGEATGNGNEYIFPFRGVSPQCMGDNIKAQLLLDGEVIASKDTYSVKEYCENMLTKSAAELGISTEKHVALQTLIKDMLVYGAKAQLYRGYKTDALVDANVTGSAFTRLTETAKEIYETDLEGVEVVGLGVYFDYVNSMYVRFTAPGMTETNFKIVLTEAANEDNAVEYTLADCTAVEGQADTYLLVLEPSIATEYDAVWYIDLYTVSGRKTTCVQYNTYSIASYVYAMQDRTTDGETLSPMAQLARATYNYGKAAVAYAAVVE